MTLEQFFAHYAALSMGDDDRALAAVYAPSFFVGGPTGSMTFANDAKFLEWLAHVRTFNRQHGMRAISPAAVRETVLSPWHCSRRYAGVRDSKSPALVRSSSRLLI